ncbi:Cof-type HAD-IIB family hydrolase [Undibacterium sp. Jales W-56]|uniref:HAD family hydrolase n=1 Tax=Undibacterium sp. Jales W-56 TaxID=2897325 RepID=UPI0021D3E9F3|nr:HAD family hydrolase [Undibacterium sp. Jales W-56]MCU6433555.1 Cof-type HAD-IIB family hydrolase [Undibacterium sp. Jales W-56]
MSMQPLADWPLAERRQIGGILTDIDDTLTTHGRLSAEVLDAVQRAQQNGLKIIAVTGRPTYWTLPLLRLCGFDAVIAENGASAFWLDQQGQLQSMWYADATTRQEHRQQLQAFAGVMSEHFPQVQVADDAAMRVGDLAFDIAEHIPPLSAGELAQVADLIRDYGFFATTSSIHAHASVTYFSKQSMSQRVLQEVFGIADEQARRSYVFVGDSANDASMFAHYPYSVGVANIRLFLDRFDAHPRYVTRQSYGAGFVELVATLIAYPG